MVETLLVVAIALLAVTLRKLSRLHRRDEESHAQLEARLEERLRSGIKETAKTIQEETAASVTSVGDGLLAELARSRLALEQKLDALAKQIAETSRTSGERVEDLLQQVVEAGRSSGEALDAIALRTGEEALRTRRDLLEALATLQPSLDEALGEMRALHEQALQELRRPIRHAVAIRQEIQRARGRQARPALESIAAPEADRLEDEVDQILGAELAGEGPPPADATDLAHPSEVPGAAGCEPPATTASPAEPGATPTRPGRLAELMRRVQRRARRTSPSPPDARAGH